MADDWIKMRSGLFNHPKLLSMSAYLTASETETGLLNYVFSAMLDSDESVTSALRTRCNAPSLSVTSALLCDVTLVTLLRVWCSINEHCKVESDDAFCTPMTISDIDTIAGFSGFGDAMNRVGWVEVVNDNTLMFPNFREFNSPACIRKPAKSGAERQKAYRDRKKSVQDAKALRRVTESDVTLQREEKSINEPPTKLGDTDGDLEMESFFISAWNSTDGVRQNRGGSLGVKRRKAFRIRIRDPDWNWKEALAKFPLKCFQDDDNPWKPDVDWFLKPDSVQNLLEGKYDWTKSSNGPEKHRLGPGQVYDPSHKPVF